MLVRDIDRKLDMRVVLRLRQNTELFNLTRELKGKFPVFLFNRDEETWMSTYFPREQKSQRLEIVFEQASWNRKGKLFCHRFKDK